MVLTIVRDYRGTFLSVILVVLCATSSIMMTLGANVLAHVPRCLQRSKGPVSRFSSHELPMDAVIVSLTRTPIGKLGGPMSALSGPRLGSIAIKGAVEEIEMDPSLVEEVYMGNVLSAGIGQAPARQAALYAGKNPKARSVSRAA